MDTAMPQNATLRWSASLTVGSTSAKLPGDKILLPPSALEQLLSAAPLVEIPPDRRNNGPLTAAFDPFNPYTFEAERRARQQLTGTQPQLPHPLTFRLVNPQNNNVVYAGIREFSAEEGQVMLSESLISALHLQLSDNNETKISVIAQQLPKGEFVKLRPLEAGYDADDWKALLEQHLRSNFTTLTKGAILVVPGSGSGSRAEPFRLLVDEFRPEGDGICIVDTDLEVDIEALNEEQARETVKKLAERSMKAPGTLNGSSAGGRIDLFQEVQGQILDGEYVDYELPSWDRASGIEIKLVALDDERELDLFINPFGPSHRTHPKEDDHVFSAVQSLYPRIIQIPPTNTELETAESIRISIHSYSIPESPNPGPAHYTLSVNPINPTTGSNINDQTNHADEVQCKNCRQWIPKGSLLLHENFCYRNNILCPHGCNQVFQKRSQTWASHWHCPHDSTWGNSSLSKSHHDHLSHTDQEGCPACSTSITFPSLEALSHHRTTVCPGKLILCRFCHLQVPQEGEPDDPNSSTAAEAALLGLTPHELADGARTTECDICGKFVRLRDMTAHRAHHDLDKAKRPSPRKCRSVLCGRTRDGVTKSGETRPSRNQSSEDSQRLGLCGRCFGPLYVATHDPDGKALRRRVERRLLTQIVTGCGKTWCKNERCKTGRANLGLTPLPSSVREALPIVKPNLEALDAGGEVPFCVDEESQKMREMADRMAMMGIWSLEWCIAAAEASGGHEKDMGNWLEKYAPKKSQVGM